MMNLTKLNKYLVINKRALLITVLLEITFTCYYTIWPVIWHVDCIYLDCTHIANTTIKIAVVTFVVILIVLLIIARVLNSKIAYIKAKKYH